MKQIRNEKELLKQLAFDIYNCKKEKIVFLGGHFPLIYNKKEALEAIRYWGKYSIYSLELCCKLARYAKRKGEKVQFVFFVDDHIYEDISGLSSAQLSTRRNQLYKKMSGENARLPKIYHKILKKYGFSEKDVIQQDQKKEGRRDCLYFSEKILRASKRKIENLCAKEYIEFLEDKRYFDKKNNYMIAIIPERCKENICDFALDKEIKKLSASHVFISTIAKLTTRKGLYRFGQGITYKKD